MENIILKWDEILNTVKKEHEISDISFDTWMRPLEVYAVEGTGLNRTQSVVIHYKFIGELDMPENFDKIKVNTRKGVEVEYLRTTKTA